jgi:uncharacterized membrane protein YadS
MILAFWKRPPAVERRISYTSKKLLQYSIILLGFDMNLFNVFQVGSETIHLMVFTLTSTFLTALSSWKAFIKVDRNANNS